MSYVRSANDSRKSGVRAIYIDIKAAFIQAVVYHTILQIEIGYVIGRIMHKNAGRLANFFCFKYLFY